MDQKSERHEAERIRSLYALEAFVREDDAELAALVRAAAAACDAPMAALVFVDLDRLRVKVGVGVPARIELPRETTFCHYTIGHDAVCQVHDAREDPRFTANALVTGPLAVRAYAGAPLCPGAGQAIGTLCVMDRIPREFGRRPCEALALLAESVGHVLEARRTAARERLMVLDSARAQLVLRHTGDAVVGVSAERRILQWNPAAELLFGYAEDEALGLPVAGLLVPGRPEDRLSHPARLADEAPGIEEYECVALHRDGSRIPVLVARVPEGDPRSRPGTVHKFIRDLRPHQAMLRTLSESEDRLRRLYETTPAMLHSTDAEGRLVSVSDRWLATLGYARSEVLGRRTQEFLTPESRRHAEEEVLLEFLRTGYCENIEYQMVCKDGRVIDVLASGVVERDGQGRPLRSIASLEDVTPRRQAERRLADSESRLRASLRELEDLYEHAPCGYHSVGADGRYLRVNATELAWLGRRREEVLGTRGPAEFLAQEGHTAFGQALLRLQAGDEEQTVTATLASGRTPAVRDVTIRMSAVRDVDGRFLMTRSVVFDVTTLKNTERALHQLNAEQHAILNNDLVGIARVRHDRFHWANRGLERMLGYPPRGLHGRYTSAVFPDQPSYLEAHQTAQVSLRDSGVFRGELQLTRADGSRVWVEFSGRYFDRAAAEVLWLCTDIDARKLAEQALRSSQSFLARTGAIAGIGGWEYGIANQDVIWSDQVCQLYDVPPGHKPGLEEALAYYAPEGRPRIERAIEAAIREGTPWDLELPMISASGRHFWARVVGTAEFEDGAPVRLVGAFQDVTDQHRLHEALAESHELLRVTLDSIGDAVITTDVQGCIEWLNPVAERLTGWRKEVARGRPSPEVFRILHEETRTPAADPVADCLAQGRIILLDEHIVLVSRDGTEHGIEDSASPIRDEQGRVLGAVLVFHDVSEQRRLGKEMRRRATHDSLTDLPNRAEFESRLQRALDSAHHARATHALLWIDLDQFKLVNDACGHTVGDELLRQVGTVLTRHVRGRDTVARIGGDEFALLLEHCDIDQGMRVGSTICEYMETFRFVHQDRRFRVGASIGLVQIDARWNELQSLMQAADSACHAAKEAGRNRVRAWLEDDREVRVRESQVQWVNRLQQAMDENQFVLFGQRIIPLRASDPALHCEVLLRLRDADGSCIAPGAFLPAAERFHLMPRIDRWVVRRALDMLDEAQSEHERIGVVSINLSGQSIGDQSFHRELLAMLRTSSFDLGRLCFEITETAAITNLEGARNFIEEVRMLGVCIALDDFGSGASSFGYLKNLPVDYLKIDGQFVTDLLEDPLDGAAVRSFRDVAQVIGVRTVAEFVERAEVRDELRLLGIDMAQGFLIHRPEPLRNLLHSPAETIA